jgi:hypothetical protein
MQTSQSPLTPGEGHEFRSLCYSCSHYEFSIGFIAKSTSTFAEHICHTGCPRCVPGDCVIRCDHYDYLPGRLVDRLNQDA